MLKLTPVHKIEDLKKDDLFVTLMPKSDRIFRVGAIDGETIFVEPAHEKIPLGSAYTKGFAKTKLESMLLHAQILKISHEESN